MISSTLDFKMAPEHEEATAQGLDILPSSRMIIKMKNKLRRRSIAPSPLGSSTVVQHAQQSKRRLSSSSTGVIKRRVKTLKGLIPNSHECVGVDGLFRETADYILALQLKIQVMQTMIDRLSNSSSD